MRLSTRLESDVYEANDSWECGEGCDLAIIERLEKAGLILTTSIDDMDEEEREWANDEGFVGTSVWTEKGRDYLKRLEQRIANGEIKEPTPCLPLNYQKVISNG